VTTNTTIGTNGTTVSQTLLDTMNGTSSGSTTTPGTSAADLQSTFLQLLVAQLQNQDPTNPMDSSQMTSQLAQINTVSGISQLNTTLTSLSSQLSAGQTGQASLLIGSSVLSSGSTFTVGSVTNSDGSTSMATTPFGVQLSSAATDLRIQVKNSAGVVVNTLDIGKAPAGTLPISSWTPVDSSGNALPAGTYTISAQDVGAAASTAAPTTLSGYKVNSVVQQSDGTTGLLLSNGVTVPLTGVAAIL
jgi:flagellar basal-body rod modification protein FlgD